MPTADYCLSLQQIFPAKLLLTGPQKIERLRESHQFIGVPSVSKHTVFVDSRRDAASFSPAQYFDTVPEAVGRKHNRPRRAQLESGTLLLQAGGAGAGAGLLKRVENKRAAAYKELTQRAERHDKVAALAAKLAYEKEVAGRGRKRKLAAAEQDGRPQGPVYKWKRERKR